MSPKTLQNRPYLAKTALGLFIKKVQKFQVEGSYLGNISDLWVFYPYGQSLLPIEFWGCSRVAAEAKCLFYTFLNFEPRSINQSSRNCPVLNGLNFLPSAGSRPSQSYKSWAWWPIIPAHGSMRQKNCRELEASVDYAVTDQSGFYTRFFLKVRRCCHARDVAQWSPSEHS